MKRRFLIFAVCVLNCSFGYGQSVTVHPGQLDSSAVPKVHPHYQEEHAFDITLDSLRWRDQNPGLHVSFSSTDRQYFRSEVPDVDSERLSWEMVGWRGERLNALILVWSPDTLNQVRFDLSGLVDAKGNSISKSNLRLSKVQYVISNYPAVAPDITC